MEQQSTFAKIGNQFTREILRSPLHPMMSSKFALITVTGRKTGKPYTLAVNYTRQGNTVTIVSRRGRTWWRNLRGGAPTTLRLEGREVLGIGTVIEDAPRVKESFSDRFKDAARVPRRYRDLDRAVQDRVIVQVQLSANA